MIKKSDLKILELLRQELLKFDGNIDGMNVYEVSDDIKSLLPSNNSDKEKEFNRLASIMHEYGIGIFIEKDNFSNELKPTTKTRITTISEINKSEKRENSKIYFNKYATILNIIIGILNVILLIIQILSD